MSEPTFRHSSARVPRLYKEAGRIVQKVREEGGSFKGLVFQSKHRSLKSLYALVAETLRHGSELDALLRQTQMLFKEPRLDPWLARVLITELLWRQRPLAGPAIPLKIVQSYKSQLLSKQADLPIQVTKPVSRASRPRFVRINTLKATQQEVLQFFDNDGWNAIGEELLQNSMCEDKKYTNFLEIISSLSNNQFLLDIHISNLLVFPGSMEFYNLEPYHNGWLLLQDKASCMAAHLLAASPGSTVLDMCAAPGMKTTHVAATLHNEGTVYAIEKHQGRYESLRKVVSQAGASCVKPILGSALDFSENDLPNVEYIIVDPTCSGSGMTDRKDIFNDSIDEVSKDRLEKLASFQCAILRHAMTNFPSAKRIVYSTCSIHPEENEAVVEQVLKSSPPNFKPVFPSDGTQWMKRGCSSYEFGEYGLYARSDVDLTNGFFVTVFERSESEYVVGKLMASSSKNLESKKIKKKKDKKSGKKSEDSCSSEIFSNPALERMKKAMDNFCATVKVEDSLTAPEEVSSTKKKKKEKKVKEESHIPVQDKEEGVQSNILQDSEDKDAHERKNMKRKRTEVVHKIPDVSEDLETYEPKKSVGKILSADVSLDLSESSVVKPGKKRKRKNIISEDNS